MIKVTINYNFCCTIKDVNQIVLSAQFEMVNLTNLRAFASAKHDEFHQNLFVTGMHP